MTTCRELAILMGWRHRSYAEETGWNPDKSPSWHQWYYNGARKDEPRFTRSVENFREHVLPWLQEHNLLTAFSDRILTTLLKREPEEGLTLFVMAATMDAQQLSDIAADVIREAEKCLTTATDAKTAAP